VAGVDDRDPDEPRAELPVGPLGELAREPVEAPIYRWMRATGWGIARVISLVALALAWELFARSGAVTPFMLPPLSAVLVRIWNDLIAGELLLNTGVTLYRALAGFFIGAVAGIVLGMAISRGKLADWFFDPIISVGFPMPKIAFLPVVILWLGVYDLSKITMVSVEAIFPVVTATVIGIRGVERELLWSARNMGAGERELLWQIALPAALPQIITGLQVALPIALIVAIVTEMFMGGYGLGGAMNTASRFADSRGVFAGIVEIAVIGYVIVKLMALVRRRLLLWHQEAMAPSTV
jgi:ABC-type nitrate/sulfonate/bicarbonate transport system permease component